VSTYPTNFAKPLQIRKALGIYRVMAIVAGIALFILVVEMVMKYGMHQENFFTKNWSYIHGFIYMAYAASIANLGLKVAWPMLRIVVNLLSGFVPLAPFFAERKITAETEAILSRAYLASPN
jgi:integral membrane protein